MNYSSNSTQDFGNVLEASTTSIMPRKPSFLGAFLGRTGGTLEEDVRADAELALFRMQLTEFAVTRIAALSAMEQQMGSLTPHAAERYQALVDACTRQTLKQIERW